LSPTPRRATRAAAQAAAAAAVLFALAACGTTPTDNAPPATPDSPSASVPSPTASAEPDEPAEAYPSSSSSRAPRAPKPKPGKVDGQDPDAVATAALAVMYASDTQTDTTPHDATVRAAPYLTPTYAAELEDAQPHAAPGAQWQNWTDHHAYTTATITPAQDSGRPADTATTAYRQYTVAATAHGDNGYRDTEQVGTAFVQLTRTGGKPWRVGTLQIQ
jgi:hypothetical protein